MPADVARPAEDAVRSLIRTALPGCDDARIAVLPGGRTNAMYLVRAANGDDVVVRIGRGPRERLRRECAIVKRLRARYLPVARIVAEDCEAVPHGYFIYEYIMAATFKELAKTLDDESLAQAARAAGGALATIGLEEPQDDRLPFRADPESGANEAANVPAFLEACARLPLFEERCGLETIAALERVVAAWHAQLMQLTAQRSLVHGDFSRTNVLVRPSHEGWDSGQIVDWEFAAAGSPLIDIGHFFRYEYGLDRLGRPSRLEPHFSAGFRAAGGTLPGDWQRLARVADLAALAGGLTVAALPDDAPEELCALLRATLDACANP